MGWSYGVINGREVGYDVADTCPIEGCGKEIDRGLSYACGGLDGMYGDGPGCGLHFCSAHLLMTTAEQSAGQLCPSCSKVIDDTAHLDALPDECPSCKRPINAWLLGIGTDYDDEGNTTYYPYCSCGHEFRDAKGTQ